MTEQESPDGRMVPVSALWRRHRSPALITGTVVLLAAMLVVSALSRNWGTGSARALTAVAVGLSAPALTVVAAVAAAAEWLRQCQAHRSLPPSPALAGRLAVKILRSVRFLLPAIVIMVGNFSLGLAGAVNAVAWLSGRHAWLPRGYPTVSGAGGAWGSLAVGAFLAAILVFCIAGLVITVRKDVRSVTRVPAPPEDQSLVKGSAVVRRLEPMPGAALIGQNWGLHRPLEMGRRLVPRRCTRARSAVALISEVGRRLLWRVDEGGAQAGGAVGKCLLEVDHFGVSGAVDGGDRQEAVAEVLGCREGVLLRAACPGTWRYADSAGEVLLGRAPGTGRGDCLYPWSGQGSPCVAGFREGLGE